MSADTSGSGVVEIRNGRRAGHIFVIAMQLGFGVLFAVGGLYKAATGGTGKEVAIGILGGLAIMGVGFFHLLTAADRQVRLTLSPEGLRDHRSGGVLIPWTFIKKMAHLPGHGSATASIMLELDGDLDVGRDLATGSGNLLRSMSKVRVEITSLDTSAREFMRHVLRFAPHIGIEPLFAPRL